MTLDATAEYERVRERYAPARGVDIAIYVLGLAVLGVVSIYRTVDWFFWAGMVSASIIWELTKYRLRRNARGFAGSSR